MMKKSKLAIVIPAYKAEFLDETLKSISNQTCKDFTLYIGDDASPDDLYKIAIQYQDKINLVYKRFPENLGRKDLVAHWNRCIDLTNDEEWLWLFSDDDIMDDRCVELFYSHTNANKNAGLLHFNMEVIGKNGDHIKTPTAYPPILSCNDFFSMRINFKIYSLIVDYIFKRELYNKTGGFQNFDLAWSSDDATWLKFSAIKNIETITGATIKWRYSNLNISSITNDKGIVIRKLNASVEYLIWAERFFKENKIPDNTSDIQKIKWLLLLLIQTSSLTKMEKKTLIRSYLKKLNYSDKEFFAIAYLNFGEMKKNIKSFIKPGAEKKPVQKIVANVQ